MTKPLTMNSIVNEPPGRMPQRAIPSGESLSAVSAPQIWRM